MSELRKANTDSTYFLTFTVVGWIDVFTRSRYCDVIVDSLNYCMEHKGLDVFAYVIMPSVENEQGESRSEWMLHMFKYYAKFKEQYKVYQFWQKTSHPIELISHEMIDQKMDYIHENPVEAGLVVDPTSWNYSSANALSPLKVLVT